MLAARTNIFVYECIMLDCTEKRSSCLRVNRSETERIGSKHGPNLDSSKLLVIARIIMCACVSVWLFARDTGNKKGHTEKIKNTYKKLLCVVCSEIVL